MMTAAGVHVDVRHAEARAGELNRSAVAVGKAAEAIGWRPLVALAEGLGRTYAWIAEGA
jgi:nucleoside-diphosphate-sugar epimerase